jgi:hypothetical protein
VGIICADRFECRCAPEIVGGQTSSAPDTPERPIEITQPTSGPDAAVNFSLSAVDVCTMLDAPDVEHAIVVERAKCDTVIAAAGH